MYRSLIIFFIVIFISLPVPVVSADEAGPSGGLGGSEFNIISKFPYFSANRYDRIDKIIIYAGRFINGIEIQYETYNANRWNYSGPTTNPSYRVGKSSGKKYVLDLKSNEYIIGISGRYGNYIDSIKISTNLRGFPKYGGDGGGERYYYVAPSGKEIMGFFGRSRNFINAIGVYYRELFSVCGFREVLDCNRKCVEESKVANWLGDRDCDKGKRGINLYCHIYQMDGGDCF